MPHLTTENPHPATPASAAPLARTRRSPRKLGLIPLVCVMYLVVSGGAYGLEDAVRMAGPRLTLLLCLVVPLTLSLPTALMAAELTALMPVEGGFYFWVKEALGPFAGFAEAYLTILYTAVDMAIYPVLFAGYLSFILPLGPEGQVAVGIALVWLAGGLNFLGVRPVGMASIDTRRDPRLAVRDTGDRRPPAPDPFHNADAAAVRRRPVGRARLRV